MSLTLSLVEFNQAEFCLTELILEELAWQS